MVDGSAVHEIEKLARQASGIVDKVTDIDGVPFSSIKLHDLREPDPKPEPLSFHSLQALVDYLTNGKDDLPDVALHVVSPTQVNVIGKLSGGRFQQRFVYATAKANDVGVGLFGVYLKQLDMVIALQTLFEQSDDLARAQQLIGHLTDKSETSLEDDGITQSVKASEGVHIVSREGAPIANPFHLRPFRTFREVAQPLVPFVLRVQSADQIGLFEADAGSWRLDAVSQVSVWLRVRLESYPIFA